MLQIFWHALREHVDCCSQPDDASDQIWKNAIFYLPQQEILFVIQVWYLCQLLLLLKLRITFSWTSYEWVSWGVFIYLFYVTKLLLIAFSHFTFFLGFRKANTVWAEFFLLHANTGLTTCNRKELLLMILLHTSHVVNMKLIFVDGKLVSAISPCLKCPNKNAIQTTLTLGSLIYATLSRVMIWT
jgi:hypothetical protein